MTRRRKAAPTVPYLMKYFDTRPLLTIRGETRKIPEGALVRYIPVGGLSAIEVEANVLWLKEAGAAAVRVCPAEDAEKPVQGKDDEDDDGSLKNHASVREAVLSVAEKMKNVPQEELKTRLGEILSEVGL